MSIHGAPPINGSPPEGVEQPASFAFTAENREKAKKIVARYPDRRQASAVLALLDLAQRQHDNWLPKAAMDHVAEFLEMPKIRVYEVATFYTMFHREPVGTWHLQVCTTTPCWLCGSDDVIRACRDELGIGPGETTEDGTFSVIEVECMGACVNAPMLALNDDYYEDLSYERTRELIRSLRKGETPECGPQVERQTSAPVGGPTTLKSAKA